MLVPEEPRHCRDTTLTHTPTVHPPTPRLRYDGDLEPFWEMSFKRDSIVSFPSVRL